MALIELSVVPPRFDPVTCGGLIQFKPKDGLPERSQPHFFTQNLDPQQSYVPNHTMLCSYCTEIFSRGHTFQDEKADERFGRFGFRSYPHHPTLDSLLKSAKNGCHFCVWISNDFYRPAEGEEWMMRGRIEPTRDVSFKHLIQRDVWRDTKPADALDAFLVYFFSLESHIMYMYRMPDDFVLGPLQSVESFDNANTSSASAWHVAMGWLESCVANHKTCNKVSSEPMFRPTRVIDVGNTDQDVHLCELESSSLTSPANESARYMTLSHSWGKKKFQTLLSSNLEDFKIAIPLECLSKTFRDAITVTRRCKVRYLWIDSLCIIQDCEKDWERESATMADVYTNTYLNIAATWAKDGDDGCFSDRDPLNVAPYLATVSTQVGEGRDCLPPGQYVCRDNLTWTASVERSPLARRAWVLQERFLAPRTLHFGAQQLYWECCEQQFCEAHPDWSQQQMGSNLKNDTTLEIGMWTSEPHLSSNSSGPNTSPLTREQELKIYGQWHSMVFSFTSCGLTVDTDKLVAFSAIARMFQRRLRDEYIAGMWRRDLLHQLDWFCDPPMERSQQYCAPTWSWASTKNKVLNACNISHLDIANTLATVEEVSVELSTENKFGAVKSGFLCLRGHLIEARVSQIDASRGNWVKVRVPGVGQSVKFNSDISFTAQQSSNKVFLLPIKGSFPGDGDENNTEIIGLVLQATNKKGTFTRIGRFDIGTVRYAKTDMETCGLLFARNEAIPELNEFEDGVRKYVMPPESVRRQEWKWRQFRITII